MITFTLIQQDMIDGWLESEADDLARLQKGIDQAQAALDELVIEQSIYQTEQSYGISQQDVLLTAKATALTDQNELIVEYLTAHPTHGGGNITAWDIYYMDALAIPPAKVIVYSHTVNWDNDAAIVYEEDRWNVFTDLIANDFYGTQRQIDALQAGVTGLTAEKAVTLHRNNILRTG